MESRPIVALTAPARVARRKLTRVEFAQLMLNQEGCCAACREKLKADLIIDEHLTPLSQGGSNELENRALYCRPCAWSKTEEDQLTSLHGQRVRGEIGQQARRRARALSPSSQSRTFLTNRDGPLKRKMNGQVVRRRKRRGRKPVGWLGRLLQSNANKTTNRRRG